MQNRQWMLTSTVRKYVGAAVLGALTTWCSTEGSAQARPLNASSQGPSIAGDWSAPMLTSGKRVQFVFTLRDSTPQQMVGTVVVPASPSPRAPVTVSLRGDSVIVASTR